jgi:hypothetical protein
MLHMAQADPSLPTKLLSARGARRSYGAATDGATNFVEIVARAVNLEHFDGDGRLPQIHAAIRGKPLKTCKGIDDAPTLVSLACGPHPAVTPPRQPFRSQTSHSVRARALPDGMPHLSPPSRR